MFFMGLTKLHTHTHTPEKKFNQANLYTKQYVGFNYNFVQIMDIYNQAQSISNQRPNSNNYISIIL